MKQLTKHETFLMMLGGGMMVVAAGLSMVATLMSDQGWAQSMQMIVPWFFLIGAILFVAMQRMQVVTTDKLTLRRLFSIQFLSGISLIIAGLLMVENYYHFVQPLVVSDINTYFTYLQVVHNNWVVFMLIGAMLQMYTAHRISSELNKES